MNGSESILLLEQDERVRDKIKQKRRRDGLHVMATGGGAYKFYNKIRDRLGVDMYREDEMECLIVGQPSSLSSTIPSRSYPRFGLYASTQNMLTE